MKKHLIAAAVAAAVAVPAAAQVTVYGLLDIGYTSVDNQRTGAGFANPPRDRDLTDTGNGEGALSTSRLGFQGSEDLGGGMKASFRLEYGVADAGNGGLLTGARESWVALDGSFGQVKLGRASTAIHHVIAGFSTGAANNTAGAIYTSANNNRPDAIRPHQVYQDNLVQYVSPNMNGFTVTAEFGKQDDESTTGAGARSPAEASTAGFNLRYSSGPLNIGAAYQKRDSDATVTNSTGIAAVNTFTGVNANSVVAATSGAAERAGNSNLEQEAKTSAFGASYNLGVVTPFLLHARNEFSNDLAAAGTMVEVADAKATEIGLRIPVASTTNAWVSYYSGDVDFQQTGNQVDVKGYQVGATYSMSKRTTLYTIFGRAEQSFDGNGVAANTRDSETDAVAFGIRHTF